MSELSEQRRWRNRSKVMQRVMDPRSQSYISVLPKQQIEGARFSALANTPVRFKESIAHVGLIKLRGAIKAESDAKLLRHLVGVEESDSHRMTVILLLKWRLRFLESGKNEPEPDLDHHESQEPHRAHA